ncbi:hypothetical protein DFH09DRAFT_1115679 [Mycena vulgaris]|nr:hypothetical protein DFH09DRAFT_1115679 [Mycena vulgaris]
MAPPARVNRAKTKARARVRVPVTTVNRDGINVPEMRTLNAKACTELAEQTNREMLEHIAGLSEDRLRVFRQMRDIPEDSNDPSDYEDGDEFGYNDVADGTVPIEISHGGGELGDLQDALNEAMTLQADVWVEGIWVEPSTICVEAPMCWELPWHHLPSSKTPATAGAKSAFLGPFGHGLGCSWALWGTVWGANG